MCVFHTVLRWCKHIQKGCVFHLSVFCCVWMRTRLKPALPLWGEAQLWNQNPLQGQKKKDLFCFKTANLFICHIKTQHISSDNNPILDKCGESTLRNQRFSDLYALRNSKVWNQPLTKMQKKGKPDSQQRNIYFHPSHYANIIFVPYFLNLPRIFVTS